MLFIKSFIYFGFLLTKGQLLWSSGRSSFSLSPTIFRETIKKTVYIVKDFILGDEVMSFSTPRQRKSILTFSTGHEFFVSILFCGSSHLEGRNYAKIFNVKLPVGHVETFAHSFHENCDVIFAVSNKVAKIRVWLFKLHEELINSSFSSSGHFWYIGCCPEWFGGCLGSPAVNFTHKAGVKLYPRN